MAVAMTSANTSGMRTHARSMSGKSSTAGAPMRPRPSLNRHKHHANDDACESNSAEAREIVPHESSTGGSDGAEASNVVVFTRQDENEE